MKALASILLCGLAVIAVGVASPVVARSPRATPLYATTVQMHFAAPNGKTRTVTENVYVDAGHGCPGPGIAMAEQYKHPDLAGMKLTGISCEDRAGAARPGGPAVVLLRFVVDGKIKTTMVDHRGSVAYDMKTCPFVLRKDQADLVAQVKGQFPGGKFVNAECTARPKYSNSFLKSAN